MEMVTVLEHRVHSVAQREVATKKILMARFVATEDIVIKTILTSAFALVDIALKTIVISATARRVATKRDAQTLIAKETTAPEIATTWIVVVTSV